MAELHDIAAHCGESPEDARQPNTAQPPAPSPGLCAWLPLLAEEHPSDAVRLAELSGPLCVCHMDLHSGNLIDTPAGMFVIDFVDGGLASPLLDAAVGAAYWGGEGGPDVASSFLAGYVAGRVVCPHAPAPHVIVGMGHVSAAARLLALRAAGGRCTRRPGFLGLIAALGPLAETPSNGRIPHLE